MDRVVALKILNPKLLGLPDSVARFRREVKGAARLSHPNIVTAYDAEQAGDSHFLVMEYVQGISLARLVEVQGPLPVGRACSFIRQAALGLEHAFKCGMVHRDIKPQNLMVVSGESVSGESVSGEGKAANSATGSHHSPLTTPRVKILDFGLAR